MIQNLRDVAKEVLRGKFIEIKAYVRNKGGSREKVYIYIYIKYTSIYVYIHIYPEKAMAPHSSTLAWKIPWTEEPGGLQSMGLLRVGHN